MQEGIVGMLSTRAEPDQEEAGTTAPDQESFADPANSQPINGDLGEIPDETNNNDLSTNDDGSSNPDGHLGNNGPNLLAHHLVDLQSSGLTNETIRAAGIYSEANPAHLAQILGWRNPVRKIAPALVFPYSGPQGYSGYSRIKPDNPRVREGSPVKYESPKGRPNEIYFPPGVCDRLNDTAVPLHITEGEKKALALVQHGYTTLGLVGVFGWKEPRQESLRPALELIPVQGRDVFIVFDSDVRHKPGVRDAETRLAVHMKQRGAHVKVVRIPDGPQGEDNDPTKLGVDDYLVAHGGDAFRRLLAEAVDPAEPSALQMRRPGNKLDPCAEIQKFLDHHQEDGVSQLVFWRGSWYLYRDGYYAELTKDEAQGTLVRYLNQSAYGLTTHIVANHMMQLRAQASLSGDVSPPAWIAARPREWKAHEILACPDRLIHLPSLVSNQEYSIPSTPRFFTPVALDYDFDVDATRPNLWLEFLEQLWPGDPESKRLLQEWFGYCLTLDTSQQKILMVVGPRRSGKGTFARILRRLIGNQNVAGPTLASLGTNFGLWPLLGKSVAIISDARLGQRVDSMVVTERLLSISGEDALTIDRKNMSAVTCRLDSRLMLLTNELPRFTDASGALAGRMMILRLLQSWYQREDPGLYGRLERELPGILMWAIAGWHQLRERGHFLSPGASGEIQDELNDLTSPVTAFVRQRCVVGPEHEVTTTELYEAYKTWCQREGTWSVSNRAVFGRDLRAAVSTIGHGQRHHGTRLYRGIGLQPATAQDPQHPQRGPQQANPQPTPPENA